MTEAELDLGNINFGAGPVIKDPKPTTKSRNSSARPVGRPSKDARQKELANEIGGFLKLANMGLMTRDLHEVYDGETLVGYASCLSVYVTVDKKNLPVLTPEGGVFAEALANVVIDIPFLMKVLDSGDKAGKWIQLVMALQPLVMTVIDNHSFGRRGNVSETAE